MTPSPLLNDFAPELLHCVFHFCSPTDLASLSRVNKTFQRTAEYLLYRHIHVSFDLFNFRLGVADTTSQSQAQGSLFYTLKSTPQKAALLRYFYVHLKGPDEIAIPNRLLLEQIVYVLRNAHGLVDLRIMMLHSSDASKRKLSQVITSGHFQLHTLYCDSYQDLEELIVSQKHLRLLGIHNRGYFNVSRFIKNRCNTQIDSNRILPGIFMLTYSGLSYKLHRLTLFPELCPPGQALTLCREIALSLGQDLGKCYDIVPADCTLSINVFDVSYAKAAIICEVVEAMAQIFVDCQAFAMWIQTTDGKGTRSKPWRIPGFSTSISRFKQLQCLEFWVSSADSLRQSAIDLQSFLLKEFVHTGLTRARVWLDGYSVYAQLESDFGWDIVIVDEDE